MNNGMCWRVIEKNKDGPLEVDCVDPFSSVGVLKAVEPPMELSGWKMGPPIFMTEAVMGMPPML